MRKPKFTRIEFKERLYSRRYLVPNAVTLANMFCGFICLIYASSDRFDKAALAIGIAILLDGLDGRVARRLNATSKFGVEFDSFSDLVSFGVAPAFLMYQWCFKVPADEIGVSITFAYVLCAAARLARFNIASDNLRSFTGLPTPGAAGVVAAIVNFAPSITPSLYITSVCGVLMLSLAALMVSRIEFLSIKTLKLGPQRLLPMLTLGAMIALIWYNTHLGFLLLAASYALSGPFNALLRRGREKGARRQHTAKQQGAKQQDVKYKY
ncbi:MAG: CDP-diacylglycerol--serine O-phosphatidyltransferase [Bdellovibrionales bacterium]|nr:CDP-diacylglycerol--serine O-phosphatidyltransferase [Bdellovibrionales bacterium]